MSHRVVELHNIMPIANLASVLKHGILSNHEITRLKLEHQSVARQDIQDERDKKQIPQGLMLHQYANLYFNARNPMMFKRKDEAENLCVLRISRDALNIKDVVLADQNATSPYVRFLSPDQINLIDFNMVHAEDWTHRDNRAAYYRHRSVMCAEVLVPKCIPACLIVGAYVINDRVSGAIDILETEVSPRMFFQ